MSPSGDIIIMRFPDDGWAGAVPGWSSLGPTTCQRACLRLFLTLNISETTGDKGLIVIGTYIYTL